MAGDIGFLDSLGPRPNIRNSISETLQAAVISEQLEPGRVYSAPKLAAQFGVSATPVREAMIDLVRDGLVDAVPNRGFRVRELSDRELDELCQIRLLIEPPTVAMICERGVDRRTQARLRSLAEASVAAATQGDLVAHSRTDLDFHSELLTLSGNANLVEVVRSLRKRSRLHGLASLANRGKLVASAREHIDLLELIADRDAVGAEALMRKHIDDVRTVWSRHD